MEKANCKFQTRKNINYLNFSDILFPVLLRAAAFHTGKYLSIIIGVCKSGFLGDVHNAVTGIEKEFEASLYTVFLQEGKQGNIHVTLKQSAAFTFTEMDVSGNVI